MIIPTVCFSAAAACFGLGGVAYLSDKVRLKDKRKMEYIIDRCGIKSGELLPKLLSKKENDIGVAYTFTIPTGMSIADFQKKQQALEQAFKCKLEIKLINNYAVIQTIATSFKDSYPLDLSNYKYKGMVFGVGRSRSDKEVLLDLTGNDTHSLVVGGTGSGKSVALNVLITQFILAGIDLILIDLKAVEFVLYQDYKNLKGFAIDEEGAYTVLMQALEKMKSRYDHLLSHRCKNYTDYNQKYPNKKMKPLIVIIDEFQSLIDNKEAKKVLFMLLTKARAANIIIILSCQSPRHEIIDGRMRDNIKNYLIFRCETEVASAVATGEQGNATACKLKGKGHGLLKVGGTFTEFQGYFLSDGEIEGYIKPYEVPYNATVTAQDKDMAQRVPNGHMEDINATEAKIMANNRTTKDINKAKEIDLSKIALL